MKKRNYIILFAGAAAALALVSCTKEKEADIPASDGIRFKIIARSAETKTVNDGLSTRWVEGDAVNVFHAVAGSSDYVNDGAFTITDVEDGVFSGTLSSGLDPTQSYDWYVLYPYSEESTSPEEASVVFPSVQSQTWDGNMAQLGGLPLAGKTTTEVGVSIPSVSMKQLAAVIQVGVTNSVMVNLPLTEVKLTAPVSITGNYTVDLTDPSNPVYTKTPEGGDWQTVTLSASSIKMEGGGGSTCYLAVKPFTAESASTLTLSVNGYEKSVELDAERAFSAGSIYDFGFNYDMRKRVVCWGDSFTSANYEEGTTYCKYLQALLGDEWIVYNGGGNGDRTDEIAARQGGLPVVTGSAFTIPADTRTIWVDGLLKTRDILGNEGFFNFRRMNSNALMNPCKLIGTNGEEVLCDITFYTTNSTKLKRLTPGEPVKIAEHTPIETYAARELRDPDLTIIYMGQNGTFGSNGEESRYAYTEEGWQNLASQHWDMINFANLTRTNPYLVLGGHTGRTWDSYGYSAFMEREFGTNYLNLRRPVLQDEESVKKWLVYSGLYSDESEIPQDEVDYALSSNSWPRPLRHAPADVHPNEYGAKVIAKVVYDKMVELGYVD